MPKTIKSSTRKLLFTMISKFKDMKSDINLKSAEKIQLLDSIIPLLGGIDNDERSQEIKLKVVEIIEILKKKEDNAILHCETNYLEKISSMTEVSLKTLRRIKKEGSLNQGHWDTPGKKRPHSATVSNLDDFDISAIRNKINEFYCVKKQVPTLRSLHNELKEAIGFRGCRETLRKILHKNGFEFQNNKNERALLVEKYEIAAWRHRYLRKVHEKRLEGKQIIYLDETYVHQNYKIKKSWQGPSTSGVTSNISTGKRHIIVHAGSEEGFVPNALLVFSTKSKSADYHDDMNATNFMKWLEEMLIPNLSKPSVLVMDNASYHVKQMNKPPTMSDTKTNIQKWLQVNNINFEEYHTKAELMCLVKDNKFTPVYEAEEILKKCDKHNHEILLLPPYHCDLNAIELVWSQAKRKVASKNIGIPGSEMQNLIKECFESITSTDWKKYTDHVLNVENQYKLRDRICENELEKFIITVGDSSSEESDAESILSSALPQPEIVEYRYLSVVDN